MPLLVGATLYSATQGKNEWDVNTITETLAQTLDPLSEMSFVSSLDDILSSYGSGTQKIKSFGENMAQSYFLQFFPTIFSQLASTFDGTKRSTKASQNSPWKFGEETYRKAIYKIPFLRNTLEPSTDIWGNEKQQADNIIERAFDSFIAPYSKYPIINTKLDDEIKRVYNETGEAGVIPSIPQSYITYENEKYNMSAKEYTEYKKTYGSIANTTLNELVNNTDYKSLNDEDKAKAIENVYKYAGYKAKQEYFDDKDVDYYNPQMKNVDKWINNGGNVADYYANKEEADYSIKYEDRYNVITQITDFETFEKYDEKLKDIKANTKDDRNETFKYIESLNLSPIQKAIYMKLYYKSFTAYDTEIFNYINNQNISKQEKISILKKLGLIE